MQNFNDDRAVTLEWLYRMAGCQTLPRYYVDKYFDQVWRDSYTQTQIVTKFDKI